MRKHALVAALAATGLALAACGSSTVDSEDVNTTAVAPSTRAQQTNAPASESAPAPSKEDPALEGEGAAREVSDFPANEPMRPEEDEAFLEALREGGVDVKGNEEQLISTARTVCDGSDITRDAVAGQLIEQQRTKLSQEELAKLIDASAHDTLCRS